VAGAVTAHHPLNRNALAFVRPLAEIAGISIRTHVYGFMAANAPLLHLRRLSGGDLFETYPESFDNVWNTAKPEGALRGIAPQWRGQNW
jgi:hypothetical protein